MVVLSAIGRFFKKIWDWIRQTAWIQPLLIVGVIFGVIFSIPSIVKAVNASKKEKSTYAAYYHNYKYSLEGGAESKADKLTDDLYEVIKDNSKAEDFKSKHSDLGDKFFLAYVEKECKPCEDAKEGFAKFEKENSDFHLVTIFADDETSESTDSKTAFNQYQERHLDFFAEVGSIAYETDYFKNGHISDADDGALKGFETADPDNFSTPSILLVELSLTTEEITRGYSVGVTEIMFSVEGSNKGERARTLSDCWNHTGEFSLSSK